MKAKAQAPSNIALIKYWGKYDKKLRIPANSSISFNLSEAFTTTSVEFDEKFESDTFIFNGKKAKPAETERVSKHLNLLRNMSKIKHFAKVESRNNFPSSSGIASSASGFAALTLAASSSLGLTLSEKGLSILARLGSGSACRSIPDGFVEWKAGKKSEDSFAHSLYPADFWDICDLVAVTEKGSKKTGSTEGHSLAQSSPFYKERILGMDKKIKETKSALKNKDFTKLGELTEAEAVSMHSVMMTSTPALFYWTPKTLEIMKSVISWRSKGLETYFTIDAGPNVHIICQSKDVKLLRSKLEGIKGIKDVLINRVSNGAKLLK